MATKRTQVYGCGSCGSTVGVVEAGSGTLTCCEKPMKLVKPQQNDGDEPHVIVGVHVIDRDHHAPGVQSVLTQYGANIKTRLGLHDVNAGACSQNGLILIEYIGDDERCDQMIEHLAAVEGVEVKRMIFEHV